ncbi:MAG: hypothetical protein HYS13_08705 [Planctomycetia bacterium]|nr:hypothetical protein [Planctomycetia bacterium]
MDKKTLEMIDACRSQAPADLAQPELAPLRELLEHGAAARESCVRLARVDAALREAARDVPVPDGLADRLLAALRADAIDQPPVSLEPALCDRPKPDAEGSVDRAPTRARLTRREIWESIVTVAVVVSLVLGLGNWLWQNRPGELSAEAVADWIDNAQPQIESLAWNDPRRPPADAALDVPSSRLSDLARGQWAACTIDGKEAVAYRWTRSQTELYVIRCATRTRDFENRPPPYPQIDTGGRCVGVWASDGLLYVLIVRGPRPIERYSELVGQRIAA